MKIISLLACFLFLAAGAPAALEAEVTLELSYKYFPVPYDANLTISQMVNKSTPLRHGGRKSWVGQADWRIGYRNISFARPSIDVCKVDIPAIACECIITLPKLEGAPPAAEADFKPFFDETLIHEKRHCDIALQHARRLERIFLNMDKTACKRIYDALDVEFKKTMSDCRREQSRFDYDEYGYAEYLRLGTLQSMADSGFNIKAPKESYNLPRVDTKKRNLTSVAPNAEELQQGGIYKDENGVWRNY
ncbi:DUF922 domain-containing protein [Deltaproteobacteria bacterium OttesenSCG-928-K17]|nr:DUF922 domain-containing protein [Deltaproteobacteria bacterium OttesenSCG-928-K17]